MKIMPAGADIRTRQTLEGKARTNSLRHLIHKTEHASVPAGSDGIHQARREGKTQRLIFPFANCNGTDLTTGSSNREIQNAVRGKVLIVDEVDDRNTVDRNKFVTWQDPGSPGRRAGFHVANDLPVFFAVHL